MSLTGARVSFCANPPVLRIAAFAALALFESSLRAAAPAPTASAAAEPPTRLPVFHVETQTPSFPCIQLPFRPDTLGTRSCTAQKPPLLDCDRRPPIDGSNCRQAPGPAPGEATSPPTVSILLTFDRDGCCLSVTSVDVAAGREARCGTCHRVRSDGIAPTPRHHAYVRVARES